MQLPRMTTRRWMVALTLVSLLLTLYVRQDRLRRIASYQCDQAIANYDPASKEGRSSSSESPVYVAWRVASRDDEKLQ